MNPLNRLYAKMAKHVSALIAGAGAVLALVFAFKRSQARTAKQAKTETKQEINRAAREIAQEQKQRADELRKAAERMPDCDLADRLRKQADRLRDR